MTCGNLPLSHYLNVFTEVHNYLDKGEVLHRNTRQAGILLRMKNGHAVKLFPSKGMMFTLMRALFRQTKAHKQWKAAKCLLDLHLRTPAPVSVKVFAPGTKYESAYIYDYLEDAVPLREVIQTADQEEREVCLEALSHDLAVMAGAGVLFIDFHLGNVLLDKEQNLWWIDPEVNVSMAKVKKKFWSRMERMYKKCDGDVLSEEDWKYFSDTLRRKVQGILQ